MNHTKPMGKTLVTTIALAFAAVSTTSAMAANPTMHCVNDKGQTQSHIMTKADCDKMGGTMMTEKEMVVKEDKMKQDKMMKEDKAKEDKMMKEDKAKEDKMVKEDKAKEDKMK